MVKKDRVCRQCSCLTQEDICPNCNSNQFLDKYKGKVVIFDAKRSVVAEKLGLENNGKFALKVSK